MRFEKAIEIDAPQQRVWDVLSDLEAWPQRIETVDVVELLTPAPITKEARCASSNPSCPKAPGTSRSGMRRTYWSGREDHRHHQRRRTPGRGAGREPRASTLTLDMRGLLIPVVLFYRGLTNRYMNLEAEGMKRAAETS